MQPEIYVRKIFGNLNTVRGQAEEVKDVYGTNDIWKLLLIM